MSLMSKFLNAVTGALNNHSAATIVQSPLHEEQSRDLIEMIANELIAKGSDVLELSNSLLYHEGVKEALIAAFVLKGLDAYLPNSILSHQQSQPLSENYLNQEKVSAIVDRFMEALDHVKRKQGLYTLDHETHEPLFV